MKGSIQENNGKYYPVIYDSKLKKHKWGTGETTERKAEAGLRKLLRDYDDDRIKWDKAPTFQAVYDDWLEMIAPECYKSQQSIATAKGYISKHILPAWAKREIDTIDLCTVQQLFYKLTVDKWVDDEERPGKKICIKQRPSAATKKKIFSIINSIFKSARSWGLIHDNPCADLTLQTPGITKKEVWTSETIGYFFSIPLVQESIYYLPLLILATTGMSRSEVCGLSWSDYHDNYVILFNGMDIFGNLTEMKTATRHRRVDLMGTVTAAIDEQRTIQTRIARLVKQAPDITSFIVTDDRNIPINPGRLTKGFSALIDQVNKLSDKQIAKIPLKNLRHSFATMLIYETEENIKIVSEILGHARTSTTQNFYQAEAVSLHKPAVQKLEGTIFGNPLGKPLGDAKRVSS